MRYHILYNPLSCSGQGETLARELLTKYEGETVLMQDVTKLKSYADFLADLPKEDKVILTGGDGTLNLFINQVEKVEHEIYYYATGSGNDFLSDVGGKKGEAPILINQYLENLPVVTVMGMTKKFINGIGFGIDGYCCEVGDEQRKVSDKPVNYTAIAIKGLLGGFHPSNAVVMVDGKEYAFKRVWIAPSMLGRYYGGGMICAPDQDRLNAEKTLSFVAMHTSGKLHTLMIFPSIFKGEHVKHTKQVTVLKGHEITVKFDRPQALQIDGETVKNVTEYSVKFPA